MCIHYVYHTLIKIGTIQYIPAEDYTYVVVVAWVNRCFVAAAAVEAFLSFLQVEERKELEQGIRTSITVITRASTYTIHTSEKTVVG